MIMPRPDADELPSIAACIGMTLSGGMAIL
jgi:hypothetical protein